VLHTKWNVTEYFSDDLAAGQRNGFDSVCTTTCYGAMQRAAMP
jgi:hypothetical protein